MKNKIQTLTILLLLFVNLKAQSPYKIDPNTGGHLLDNTSQPVRNDKNWEVNTIHFSEEFTSHTSTINNWRYMYSYVRSKPNNPPPEAFYNYNINDFHDYDNSPECLSTDWSNLNKQNHFYGETSGLTSCNLKLLKGNINGWYPEWNLTPKCNGLYKKTPVNNWFKFTTGMLESKQTFKYGFFEIRCKIKSPPPAGKNYDGLGYNFWLFGYNNDKYSEIDIFETDLSRGLMTSNTHLNLLRNEPRGTGYVFNRADPNFGDIDCGNNPKPFYMDTLIDMYNFHTFSLEWLPNNITTFYDNQRVMQYRNRDNADASPKFYTPMNIIIGYGVPYFCKSPIIEATHQIKPTVPELVEYEIDYVKVYKLILDCSTTITQDNSTNYNFNNYVYGVKNNITFGGTGCTAKVTNGMNVSLRAVNGITLGEGFEVEAGGEFYANVQGDCYN